MPCITWILPCIGHTGICKTDGIIYDFAGPYTISVDDFAFGSTHKYVQLNINEADYDRWNTQVEKANAKYKKRMHNLCCDNCHSHVANALNNFKYLGKENWTMISVFWLLITSGKYVSCAAFLKTYIGFFVIVAIITACVLLF